ncbi:MAG: hypothetical protein FWF46_00525 [Oscillospiraceae bacterium]|nr:hypothetical protein [Oscillospiraceae bacterium]
MNSGKLIAEGLNLQEEELELEKEERWKREREINEYVSKWAICHSHVAGTGKPEEDVDVDYKGFMSGEKSSVL